MMFRDLLTSGTVSGTSLTLGAGSFAAIGVGSEIQGVTADNYPTSQITFGQYRDIYLKTQSGRPLYWAFDGLATVFLYPAAVSNVIAVQTRQAISQFATLDTNYSLAPGYLSALSAQLALRVENSLNGKIAQATKDAAKATEMVIVAANVDPAIISANPMRRDNLGNGILQGWN